MSALAPLSQMSPIRFDRSRLRRPNRGLLLAVQKLAEPEPTVVECRTSPRYLVGRAFPVMPIDERGTPVGEAFWGVAKDISTGGVSILHERPIASPFLVVELEGKGISAIQLVVEVLRCRPFKQFYVVAGPFRQRVVLEPAPDVPLNRSI